MGWAGSIAYGNVVRRMIISKVLDTNLVPFPQINAMQNACNHIYSDVQYL